MENEGRMISEGLFEIARQAPFRILKEELIGAPDEAEFGLRVSLKFISEEVDTGADENIVAQNVAARSTFGFLYALAALSFADARPRRMSMLHYDEHDEFRVADFLAGLRFVWGEVRFDADYIRGRRIKTRLAVTPKGTVRVETSGRGKGALRWLEALQGRKRMLLVGSASALPQAD